MEDIKNTLALIESLNERAKELSCIYRVENILKDYDSPFDETINKIVDTIPPGWQFPGLCEVKVIAGGKAYFRPGFKETGIYQKACIMPDKEKAGEIYVYYTSSPFNGAREDFLPEEQKLLDTIADMIGDFIFHKNIRDKFKEWFQAKKIIGRLEEKNPRLAAIFRNSPPEKILEYLESPLLSQSPGEDFEKSMESANVKHWQWRLEMAEKIAQGLAVQGRAERFGVKAAYLFGSAKEGKSGPASDIDLLVLADSSSGQREALKNWFEGWSLCLSEINRQKTGYETPGLIDLHIISPEDVAKKTSYAIKIQNKEARLLMEYL